MGGAGGYTCMPETAEEKLKSFLVEYEMMEVALATADRLEEQVKDTRDWLVAEELIPGGQDLHVTYDRVANQDGASLQ